MYEYNCPVCSNPMELTKDRHIKYEKVLIGECKHCGLYISMLYEDWLQEQKEDGFKDTEYWEKIKGEK